MALSECKTAMEAKQIADVAQAARIYLERTNASVETVNNATEIRILAERQMGAFLKEMPFIRGNMVVLKGRDSSGNTLSSFPEDKKVPTLDEMGIKPHEAARAQKLAEIPEQEFHDRIQSAKKEGRLTLESVKWSAKAEEAGKQAADDSETLWKLKTLWKKTSKRDRQAFLEWTSITIVNETTK